MVDRENGIKQWAFRGKPLYTFSRDTSPADMNGDEFLQQWYVAVKPVPLPPGFRTNKTPDGHLLVDQKNMTLYTSSANEPVASACTDACAKTWQPVEAWWRARSTLNDWTIIDRSDGTKQWAYRGQPLFRCSGDFAPGDMSGDGLETWRAVVLEPPPQVPDWITIQNSDAGPLLADANGKTLYAYDLPERRAFGIGIGRDMATPHLWMPVYADDAADPIGHWSVIALNDGRYQWAYKGLKLFVPQAGFGTRRSQRTAQHRPLLADPHERRQSHGRIGQVATPIRTPNFHTSFRPRQTGERTMLLPHIYSDATDHSLLDENRFQNDGAWGWRCSRRDLLPAYQFSSAKCDRLEHRPCLARSFH